MPDFGFGFGRRDHGGHGFHHQHHHRPPPWMDQGGGGDFAPPALDDDSDMGCDPHLQAPLDATHVRWLQHTLSRMQMNFGQDDGSDDAQEPDDGSQGGVLDAVSQVASGVADMIAPSAAPEAYIPPPIPMHRHHRHHHPMDPLAYQLYGRMYYSLSAYERAHLERERIARLEHERHYGRGGRGGRWHGDFGQAMYTAPPAYPQAQTQPPAARYGQGGYRPRGQGRFNQGGGGGHGYGHGHGGHGHGHHRGHGGGGYQGGGMQQGGPQPLPPGSYQQSCSGCTFDGNTLSCTCTDTDGHNQPTSLMIPVANNQGISNHAGVLVLGQT